METGEFRSQHHKRCSSTIACFVKPCSGGDGFYCTYVYAFNERSKREELWQDLRMLKTHDPWLICGDFNSVMNSDERIGSLVREHEITPMRDCIGECGVVDIKCTCCFFTWNNKQQGEDRVFSKLDRMLGNQSWQDMFPSAEVNFQGEGDFDHSPAILTIHSIERGSKKPFRYFAMWEGDTQFLEKVRQAWSIYVQSSKMYRILGKLKEVKKVLN